MMKPNPDIYMAGGTLSVHIPTYVIRKADSQLFEELKKRHYCYVLTARQMGKSSLIVRTMQRLKAEGISSALIDLSVRSNTITEEQWYFGQADEIAQSLKLGQEWEEWWEEHNDLGVVQQFARFLSDYVLDHIESDMVVFIDEIDSTIGLPFSDDYFAAIRALHNRRAQYKDLQRLTFALLGVAAPADLIKDPQRTPFNIGKRIDLTDFTREEASPLLLGLAPDPELAQKLLDRVLFWTNGHPYLSQKACMELAIWAQREWNPRRIPGIVDETIKTIFLSAGMRIADSNLQVISFRVSGKPGDPTRSKKLDLLSIYREILAGNRVIDDDLDPVKIALKLSGLVVSGPKGLRIRNRIYEIVFDEAWVKTVTGEITQQPDQGFEPVHDVFVSYSHEDSSWVAGYLVPALKAAGLDIVSDIELLPGTDWEQELSRLRENSRYFVPVISPAWMRSRGAQEEFALMSNRVGKIVPILLRPTPLPSFLRDIQFADFVDESKQKEALQLLIQALGGQLPETLPSAPKQSKVLTVDQKQQLIEQMYKRYSREDLLKLISKHFQPLMQHIDSWEKQLEDVLMPFEMIVSMLVDYAARMKRLDELSDLLADSNTLPIREEQSSPKLFGIRLHAYVAMPFGKRSSPDGSVIDFNEVYNQYIKPALEEAGLDVFRADEEMRAGDIRTNMFQELLIADLVVADLTLDNPNVWYELGVRHALRARGVVLIQSGRGHRVFDVYTDRILNYGIKDGGPDPGTLMDDRRKLTEMVKGTMESWHGRKLSPIYNLLPNLLEPDWKSLRIDSVHEFWEQYDVWEERINSARKSQRVGDILVLAEEAPIAAFRAEAWIRAGEALRKAEHFDLALEQLERGLGIEPHNLKGLHEKGICQQRLALSGNPAHSLDRAREHYRNVLEVYPNDPETWALLGRLDKEAWIASWRKSGNPQEKMRDEAGYENALLLGAIDSYTQGYLRNPGHFYSGINALTLMHLYRDLTNDTRYDREMTIMVGAVRFAAEYEQEENQSFWSKATLGDLEVLVGTPDTVTATYKEAIAESEKDWFALNSSRAQLQMLKDLGFRPDVVEAGIDTFERALQKLTIPEDSWRPRHVFLFSGHMIDEHGRAVPRFPADKESIAAQKISEALDQSGAGPEDLALTQGACGGDILFSEACLQRGVKVQWLQPFREPEFVQNSVLRGGESWRNRYLGAKDLVSFPLRAAPEELGESTRNPYERCNLWLLYTALAWGLDKVRFICLWNGGGGDGPGGTAHMYNEVKRRTGRVTWIDSQNL